MPKNNVVTNVKDTAYLVFLAYTTVQAARGWIGLFRGVREVSSDKLNTK